MQCVYRILVALRGECMGEERSNPMLSVCRILAGTLCIGVRDIFSDTIQFMLWYVIFNPILRVFAIFAVTLLVSERDMCCNRYQRMFVGCIEEPAAVRVRNICCDSLF